MSGLLEIVKAVIFGVIMGISEWLPISAAGHLVLLNTVIPLHVFEDAAMNASFWNMFKGALQLGALLAVFVLYGKRLWPFRTKKTENIRRPVMRLWLIILIATVPVALLGLFLRNLAEERLTTPVVISAALIIYGILFLLPELKNRKGKVNAFGEITPKKAVINGLFEALALIPGTGRSAASITGSMLLGYSRQVAVEFSVFLSIPVLLGTSLLRLFGADVELGMISIAVLLTGMIVSFVTSVVVIRSLMRYIKNNGFRLFGLYCIVLGMLILILALMNILPAGLSV